MWPDISKADQIKGGLVVLSIISGVLYLKYRSGVITLSLDDAGIMYLASWGILGAISWAAAMQTVDILRASRKQVFRHRAHWIGVIIGMSMTVILFKQPYLDRVFDGLSLTFISRVIIIGSAAASGWVVWYLRHLHRYGEFFNVLLMTWIVGFSWYARLTAPETVQLTAAAFLLGSLFKIAKDYLDLDEKLRGTGVRSDDPNRA